MNELPTSNPPIKLLMNYKKHSSYSLFISSLRASDIKIKYDGYLKKYLRLPDNYHLSNMD